MKMIDKFTTKFREFASNENLENLSDEAKVALFGIYLDAIKPAPQPSGASQGKSQPANTSQSRVRKPNRPATVKQTNFIRRLIKQGKLDGNRIDIHNLTVGAASALIDKGVNAPAKPEPEPEEEQGEFTGSYTHESGSASSSANFWE
jgi:hypothetical protein